MKWPAGALCGTGPFQVPELHVTPRRPGATLVHWAPRKTPRGGPQSYPSPPGTPYAKLEPAPRELGALLAAPDVLGTQTTCKLVQW